MSWSPERTREQQAAALRFLLDTRTADFTRDLDWREENASGIPPAVWSLLYQRKLVEGNVIGGPKWRLTIDGWIVACRLHKDEMGLDQRFGKLSAHLKALGERSGGFSHVNDVARETGFSELWVFDAIAGRMAERIFEQHGANLEDPMGGIEIPAHVGQKVH
jgi:hypothetical protein